MNLAGRRSFVYFMNQHIQLAKSAIEEYIKTGKNTPVPKNLPSEFYEKKYGVFISIHKGKELRGCIGTYLPDHDNLAEEIILNAVAACSRDNRFLSINEKELPKLSIEVSLLSQPKKISDFSELDPKKFGVIVKSPDGRCGLLLPDLEGIDSSEQQFSIACQKAGINFQTEQNILMYKFQVDKFS